MNMLKEAEQGMLPYEKCLRFGVETLSDTELLAVIIRSGTRDSSCIKVAEDILRRSGSFGILGLKHLTYSDYRNIRGIGNVKAIMLQCVGELSARISRASAAERVRFKSSAEAAAYCMEFMRHYENERFLVLFLNNKCELIHERIISIGTVNFTCISPREVFRYALSYGAVNIIIVHNHPSGDPQPSREDIETTRRLIEAGEIIGISIVDHIIIGDNRYTSFMDNNILRMQIGKE